jgi:hypothetical protein
LQDQGASYRFGAPQDLRWIRQEWSSHLKFQQGLSLSVLDDLWSDMEGQHPPFVGLRELAELRN